MKDPYQVLGVSKSATQDEIRNAYRAIAKKNHPDLNAGNKEREAKFKDAAEAYERIGTPEARAKFDRGETQEAFAGAQGARGRPFYYETQGSGESRYGNMGFDEDFFENLFRQAGQGRGGRRGDFSGEDHLYQMEVDFRDAALGAEREITLPGDKKLQIRIPAGVESGARLRFKGQGGPGAGRGAPGDAYVEIHVREHPGFQRRGKDIESEVPVTFFEALTGAEIQVPTIDGSVSLKIPAGVSSGSRLRVRGKGIAQKSGERGDQIVSLKVVMPKNPPPELQRAAAEWKDKFPYSAREER